uniref:Uncharacterized protein n=1 Tax=Anguilla anguilla TaxID=7936 RepID=A0A0E9SU99_ANGAN
MTSSRALVQVESTLTKNSYSCLFVLEGRDSMCVKLIPFSSKSFNALTRAPHPLLQREDAGQHPWFGGFLLQVHGALTGFVPAHSSESSVHPLLFEQKIPAVI